MPSTSVSFKITLTVTGVSSLVLVTSFTATGGVDILIPKFTFTLLLVVKPGTDSLPFVVPSFPVAVLVILLTISPVLEQPAGREATGV